MTSSWFFLSTLNYDARSTTHQIPSCCRKFRRLLHDSNVPKSLKHRHSPTYEISNVSEGSNFGQVEPEYTHGKLYMNIHGGPVETQTPKHRNLVGQSMPAPLSLLSARSILPPRSSHCAFIPARKKSERVSKMLLFQFFLLHLFSKSEIR